MTLEILLTKPEDDNQLVRKRFAELSVKETDPLKMSAMPIKSNWGKYRPQINKQYTPFALANHYGETIKMLHRYFQDIVRHKWDPENLLYKLLLAKFTYASPKAYQLIKPVIPKEKKDDQEVNPIAHYDNKYGIYVSLPDDKTLKDIKILNLHEFGHLMHQVDAPENYIDSDPTIKEALAILLQEEEGIREYQFMDTPHGRAQQLLRKAGETKFRGKTFAEEWKLLTRFQKYEDFDDYLDDKLFLFTSLA